MKVENNIHDNLSNVKFTVEQLLDIMDNIPLCINILDETAESVYCNNYTVDLYKVKSKKQFNSEFYSFTPQKQPSGKESRITFGEYVLTALEKGEVHFSWLDLTLDGEEIPLYISIYRLNMKDETGKELLVSTMRDLRPELAGNSDDAIFDEYYHSRVTYKVLFNTVAELADEWFWIYDVSLATIQFFGKGREILGLSADRQPFPSYVVDSGMVFPDDLKAFLKFDENLRKGVVDPAEVRFIQPNGVSRYYRITYKTMYNKEGKPMFTIGKTYDVDDQKKLEVLSKTDLLTNCLNKITTENIVKDTLINSPKSSHALFLIDVDDFKSVNDELGHYFGDITLSDIAKNLHANFRGADVIGRIGGDEFLVFVKDITDESVIVSKAKAIANAFKNSYSGENNDYKISGSIGVAMYPKHADTYEGLYKCADKALYSSKMAGKDRYTIYTDEIADFKTKNLTAVDNANTPANKIHDAEITSLVFDLLYKSEYVGKSMNNVLRLFGTHFRVDRCYVSQTFDGGKSYSVTYEWTAKPELARKDKFQDVPSDEIVRFFGELETNGVMFNEFKETKDEDETGTSRSYLVAQTRGKGHARLIFGVDDSSSNRVWSEKEIHTVQYVIKLISIFLASTNSNESVGRLLE